jgi:hypothetical protein
MDASPPPRQKSARAACVIMTCCLRRDSARLLRRVWLIMGGVYLNLTRGARPCVTSSVGARALPLSMFSAIQTMLPMFFRAEPTSIVQRPHDTHQVCFPFFPSRMDLDFLNPDASIPCCSFKLHATVRELYEWTRMEKMKLKEQAVAAIAKEKQAHGQDPCREEKRSPAVNETFEGEMDNFQTPVMRRGASAPFFFTELTDTVTIGLPRFIQLSSLIPLVRLPLFHFLG